MKSAQRVRDPQHRSFFIMAETPKQLLGCGFQVNHPAPIAQMLAVGRSHNGTTTGRQNTCRILSELIDHCLLDIAKSIFTLMLKTLPNRAAQLPLYHLV